MNRVLHARPTQAVLDRKIKELGAVKKHLEGIRIIAEGAETPFWKEITNVVKTKLDRVQESLNQIDGWWASGELHKATLDTRLLLLAQKKVYEMFIVMADDFNKDFKAFQLRYDRLKGEAGAYAQRLSDRNGN